MAGPNTFTRTKWAKDLLAALGAPASTDNLAAVVAWEMAEGGHFLNSATYDPLNTTQQAAGSHDINSAGVKAYPDYQTGMAATVQTLHNGRYSNILAALAQGNNAPGVIAAVIASPWGTKSITNLPAATKEVGSGGGNFTGDTGAADPGLHIPGSDYFPGPAGGNKGFWNNPKVITNPLEGAKAALEVLYHVGAWVADRHNWIRVIEVAGGLVGLVVALELISSDVRDATAAVAMAA